MIIHFPEETTNDQAQTEPEGYKKREYVTITELDNFARCPRRYFYSSGLGFRRTDETLSRRDTAAHFGTSLGNAIPIWLSTGDFELAYNEFLRVWANHQEDDRRNPVNAKLLLYNFACAHPTEGSLYSIKKPPEASVVRKENKSEWEVPFSVEIPDLPIPLIGSIDFCAEWKSTKEDWVVECKTSTEMSERFAKGFKRNPQGLAYVLARRTQGYDCKGYIHELVSTAKNPKYPTLTIPQHVNDQDLTLFIGWLKEMTYRILDCEKQGIWPQWPSGCGTYPMFYQPGYFCEYDPLCSVPDWRSMSQYYNVKRHEPYVLMTSAGKQIVGMPKGSSSEE